MKPVDDEDIRRYISELDAGVPKEGSQLSISVCDDQGIYCALEANRAGYLRAGIEMLRAAVESLDRGVFITSVDLNYLAGKRGLLVKTLMRREDMEKGSQPLKRKTTWKQKAAGVGGIAVLLGLAACTLIGVVQIFIWVTGN